nr:short-chain dehydrogenase tic 32, chloroplastic [Quercus suber]
MSIKFNPATDIGDLSGKVIIVTGGNAGIGAATIRGLAQHNPQTIYLCARRINAAEELVKKTLETYPTAKIEILELDLNSFESVKKCAATFNHEAKRLDLLFLNAGVASLPPGTSKEGYETQFGINHMGHALLTQLVLPKMLQTVREDPSADARIMVTSSVAAHRFAPPGGIVFKELKNPAFPSWTMRRYGQSKLANVLFANKLAQLYPRITTTSIHPGTVKSDIWGKATGAKLLFGLFKPLVMLSGVTNEEGAKGQLWAATAKGVKNGGNYEPLGKDSSGQSKPATDQKLTDELWEWTTKELAAHGAPGWPEA